MFVILLDKVNTMNLTDVKTCMNTSDINHIANVHTRSNVTTRRIVIRYEKTLKYTCI